jgi:hypothetical protein
MVNMKDKTYKVIEFLAYFFLFGFVGSFSIGMFCAVTNRVLIAEICLWAYPICLLGMLICGFIMASQAAKGLAAAVLGIMFDVHKHLRK